MKDNILTVEELPFRAARIVREMARNVLPGDIRPLASSYPVGFMDRERIAGLCVWQTREAYVALFSSQFGDDFDADAFRKDCIPSSTDAIQSSTEPSEGFSAPTMSSEDFRTSKDEEPITVDYTRKARIAKPIEETIDYEPCGTCGYDHQYDNVSLKINGEINAAHIVANEI